MFVRVSSSPALWRLRTRQRFESARSPRRLGLLGADLALSGTQPVSRLPVARVGQRSAMTQSGRTVMAVTCPLVGGNRTAVVGEFFAADPTEIDSALLDDGPAGRYPMVEAKSVDPVSISTLGE